MNKTKYNQKVSILQNMDIELYNDLSLTLDKLPHNVTRTDLINAFIKHGLSFSDSRIEEIILNYKNK